MLDPPGAEQCRDSLDQCTDDFVLARHHDGGIVADVPRRLDAEITGFLDLVSQIDNREQRLAGNTAPIETDPAQGLILHHGHTGAQLRSPDGGDIPSRSGAQNGNVLDIRIIDLVI